MKMYLKEIQDRSDQYLAEYIQILIDEANEISGELSSRGFTVYFNEPDKYVIGYGPRSRVFREIGSVDITKQENTKL